MLKRLTVQASSSVLILSSLLVSDAHAYIDPGSGSALLQLILGGVAGIGVVAKLYWEQVKARCRSLFGRSDGTGNE